MLYIVVLQGFCLCRRPFVIGVLGFSFGCSSRQFNERFGSVESFSQDCFRFLLRAPAKSEVFLFEAAIVSQLRYFCFSKA